MQIQIPKPCHENWSEMTPTQHGAFCNACAKTVIDFSVMSDEEIIAYFENRKEEKICGRFNVEQLSPYELKINLRSVNTQNKLPKIFAAALFMVFSSFFVCKSESGAPMAVNVVWHDTKDTVTSIQPKIETPKTDTVAARNYILGWGTALPPVIYKDTLDSNQNKIALPDTGKLMGKAMVTPPKHNKPVPPVYKKGECRKIMGDLAF